MQWQAGNVGDAGAHGFAMRTYLRALANQGQVQVQYCAAMFLHQPGRMNQEQRTVSAPPFALAWREMLADVAVGQCAINGVAERVQANIGIRVAGQTFRMLNPDTAPPLLTIFYALPDAAASPPDTPPLPAHTTVTLGAAATAHLQFTDRAQWNTVQPDPGDIVLAVDGQLLPSLETGAEPLPGESRAANAFIAVTDAHTGRPMALTLLRGVKPVDVRVSLDGLASEPVPELAELEGLRAVRVTAPGGELQVGDLLLEPQVGDAIDQPIVLRGELQVLQTEVTPARNDAEGRGMMGYDNGKKKYVGTWLDSMGTGIMSYEGDYDPKSKQIVCHGSYVDPVMGMEMPCRLVSHMISDDQHVFEMWGPSPMGSGEVKWMEISYTRAK